MTRILALADEVDEALYGDKLKQLRPDVVVSCGDLPFEYLEYLVSRLDVPLLYVPGNHDSDIRSCDPTWAPLQAESAMIGPQGCDNADGRVITAAGLRIAGLGGSIRYRPGPNQYTQAEMRWRALSLEVRLKVRPTRHARKLDVLITHAPPFGLEPGREDFAHRGFAAFHRLARELAPRFLIHGHVHLYGRRKADRRIGGTLVVNAVPSRLVEI